MGKKSKEANADVIDSLFGADNPFRRKPEPDIVPEDPASPAAATTETKKRKRKSDKNDVSPNPNPSTNPNPSPHTDPIPKKRNKLEAENGEEGGSPKKKRRKRKRDELEQAYERKVYGEEAAEAEAEPAVVVGAKRKATDEAEEVVAKDEFDDESKLLRTVFVGNLPLKTKRKALVKEFEKFGEIDSVRIRSVPILDSKVPRKGAIIKGRINDAIDCVHAYIVFKDEQTARAALSRNMSEVGGNHIRVDMACPPRKKSKGEPLYDRKKTLFVGNLPFDVKDEELYQLFCGVSQSEANVEAVRVIRDPNTSLGKGIAYVLFKTREAANTIARKRNLKVRDRLIRICHAKLEATPTKRVELSGPKREENPRKRMASSSIEASSGRNDKLKVATPSYQGLRASKSGVLKKSGLHTPSHSTASNHGAKRRTSGGTDPKVRIAKRPAVAARKAKLLKKRKQESATPESTHRNNKRFKRN